MGVRGYIEYEPVGKPATWCIGIVEYKGKTFCTGRNTVPGNLRRFACTLAGVDIRKN
jgi:hypothetical protein